MLQFALLRLKSQQAEPGWLALPTHLLRLMLHVMLHLGSSHQPERDATCVRALGLSGTPREGESELLQGLCVIAHLKNQSESELLFGKINLADSS